MFTNDLHIDEDKATLVHHHKRYIESAFNVTVCGFSEYTGNGDGSNNVGISSVHLSSHRSQESLKKAKKYITVLTKEGEDFHSVIVKLSIDELNMVIEKKTYIENESQAFLDFIENSTDMCVYGTVQNVMAAQALVQKLREPQFQMCSTLYTREKSNIMCIETTQRGSNDIPLLIQRQDSIQTDGGAPISDVYSDIDALSENFCSNNFETDIENNYMNRHYICDGGDVVIDSQSCSDISFGAPSSSSHTKSSLQTSLPSHSDDDENDEEVESIIHDTSNRTKLEFALKLGYSERQIATVLKKLGQNVGQNEMLSELIKIGMSSTLATEDEGSDADESFFSSDGSVPFLSYSGDDEYSNLRPIVIDGSNVAMSHGNKELFSCQGIQLAVDWFQQRGHTQITVFVPQWRKETSRPDARITDQEILKQLEKEKILVFTPARRIGGKRVVCYDDRYILKLAAENDGIVVSNDNYRDLINEKPEYKKVVEERLLMFSFVNDRFMPPDDPLGRHGPNLDNFLSSQPQTQENLPPLCPYGSKKCTYGNKCKYYHPERGNIPHKSVTDKLAEQTKLKIQEVRAKQAEGAEKKKQIARKPKMALQRTKSLATELPADLVSDRLPFDKDFQKLSVEDVLVKDSNDKDDKWKQYNDRLSEHRRKLEKAELEEKQRQEDEIRKQKEIEHLKSLTDEIRSNTPSPSNRLSPSPIRPQEQFLSGHLLLAKKLSDEANESKIRRNTDEHSYTKSPLAATQSQPVISSPTQSNPPQPQHKKLSRQYSLQGAQDPRLKPNVRQQVSYDPNMLLQQRGGGYTGDYYRQSSHTPSVHDQSKFYRSEEEKYSSSYVSESYRHEVKQNQGNFLMPDSYISQHMALTRMQSAPEVPQHMKDYNQHMGRPIGKMMRQNSSSDTQLHMHGTEGDLLNYSLFPSGDDRSTYTTRQDSVTYNIGTRNESEQYKRSMSGQYQYHADHMYSQHQNLSHDPRWINQSYQQNFMNPSAQRFPPMAEREVNTLRSRGGQMWQSNTPHSPYTECERMPYQQPRLMIPSNSLQSQINTPPEVYGAQSHPMGGSIHSAQVATPQTSSYQPISPNDQRYSVYYHLCALFPEPKVRAIMNQYPDIDNPQELCAYLIGAK